MTPSPDSTNPPAQHNSGDAVEKRKSNGTAANTGRHSDRRH